MKLIAIDLKLQAKLKVSIMIPPTLWPSAAWGSRQWTILRFECEKVFCWELWWRGPEWGWPGREPRPGLGFLPWPVTQKYLSKPPLVVHISGNIVFLPLLSSPTTLVTYEPNCFSVRLIAQIFFLCLNHSKSDLKVHQTSNETFAQFILF